MNLNDVVQDIPTVIRGRFAGNANAAWIRWAGQTISRINEVFPGLGRVRKTPVRLMKSGFIRNPGHLRQISNIFVDRQEVIFTQQLNGVWLNGDDLTEKGLTVSATEYPAVAAVSTGEAAAIFLSAGYKDFAKDIAPAVTCKVVSLTEAASLITIRDLSGAEYTSLTGRKLYYGSDEYRIESQAATASPGVHDLTVSPAPADGIGSSDVVTISGFTEDALAGWAFAADSDFFEISGSQWVPPEIQPPGGWTSDVTNKVDFMEPARAFTSATGVLFKSNVVAQGYGLLKRPTSMTEKLDLPEEYLPLLATGMRLKAELDMAPAGADAGAVMALFEKDLRRYANDHQNADGRSVKRAFNCSPRLGRYAR